MRHTIKHAACKEERQEATIIKTGSQGNCPSVSLTTLLPEGRQDLALFLAQRLYETVKQFKHDYLREELL